MSKTKPYQPFLLRLFHNINGLLVIACIITGFLVYDSWDGRFGKIGLTIKNRSLIDIHGTFAFALFFVFLGFIIVSIKVGKSRLVKSDDWQKLTKNVGKNIWWYTLHRAVNTTILFSAILSIGSGKFQNENWLANGEIYHFWYSLHLISWLIMLLAIATHLLMSTKVGGYPLILSMFNTKYMPQESPKLWLEKIIVWLKHPRW
ncbi:cytochrome b/b6 domain-containing protein [Okeania sp.]|uniref:cytochrome b/b6 domain-containing protein n=1 Tax=Okeania sp. TaxID=3100323 RepID=UPI002B4B456F|nr:cytochrome b/b6 domain-containing protein [Okeania sp.]MEB3341929.1 cytochrome b/b6 domain-containing protein [Okeania sp.]